MTSSSTFKPFLAGDIRVLRAMEKMLVPFMPQRVKQSSVATLNRQLSALNQAATPEQMDIPGWRLHALAGGLNGHWSVWVNGNWRLTFAFEGQDAVLGDYQDYH